MPDVSAPRVVAVVGAGGYIGRQFVNALARDPGTIERVVAMDVKPAAFEDPHGIVTFEELDVRSARLGEVIAHHHADTVVHLASVVTPPRGMTRNEQYAIDVDGTHNVLEACVEHGVRQLVVTSSGAAYGYHVDNPSWIHEGCALRGNEEFPYARHKRLVEELLARYRERHPGLAQLVFRPGTILGPTARNQITALFERPVMLKVSGGDSRFVFAWDADVVACLVKGIRERRTGTYNLAGDGAMTAEDIAAVTGARVVSVPATWLAFGLSVARAVGATDLGPEHVGFLRYRPVLSNAALKSAFGFVPTHSSREAFEAYWRAAQAARR